MESMIDPLSAWPVSQTWEQHVKTTGKPGTVLGGVDHAMAVGTRLPILEGQIEYVTSLTNAPSWYNSGLGYAMAFRRPDGTRTIYGHLSGRAADGTPLSGGKPGSPGAGTSRGPHCHTHDVLADGRTRAYPGSTVRSTPASTQTPIEDIDMPDAIQLQFDAARGGEIWLMRPGSAHHQEDIGQFTRARDILRVPTVPVPAGPAGDGLVAAWAQVFLLPEVATDVSLLSRTKNPSGSNIYARSSNVVVGGTPDAQTIAELVEGYLQDNLDALPTAAENAKAVNDDAAARLQS